jgi:hypothetical protein
MEALLRAEILTGDNNFDARFDFVWFNLGDSWALALVADRVSFDFCGIEPLDRLYAIEGEACAIYDRAWLLRVG